MSAPTLTDGDVFAADTERVVAAMESAFREHAAGTLVAPPRWSLDVPAGELVFTAGAALGRGAMGFRVYETLGTGDDHTQLVAVFDSESGAYRGQCVGHAVGLLRTGGIGGVAIDHLAPRDASTVGVLGSGAQARSQLEAACAVRDVEAALVYSPTREHRESFAATLRESTGVPVEAVESAEAAVRDCEVLVCATDSDSPVFDPEWLAPGAHVTTLGPKFAGAHELPLAMAEAADCIATDSLAQVEGYAEYRDPFFLDSPRDEMVELSAVVAGDEVGRESDDDLTLFCSVGLAGTEVVLADALLSGRE
ncbi:ornithine cyclodeaminase family protein [Halomarina litorea]|uniref:ornithine cyclodeaminase family protein n=1 Tax=Halomarina litorea TaxID=2961595 RepID=UPI0020C3E297|nr:ornithine cyclodeaminase family protein [Halomarina sp. BCD28]